MADMARGGRDAASRLLQWTRVRCGSSYTRLSTLRDEDSRPREGCFAASQRLGAVICPHLPWPASLGRPPASGWFGLLPPCPHTDRPAVAGADPWYWRPKVGRHVGDAPNSGYIAASRQVNSSDNSCLPHRKQYLATSPDMHAVSAVFAPADRPHPRLPNPRDTKTHSGSPTRRARAQDYVRSSVPHSRRPLSGGASG
jgi:hypothetical protein